MVATDVASRGIGMILKTPLPSPSPKTSMPICVICQMLCLGRLLRSPQSLS